MLLPCTIIGLLLLVTRRRNELDAGTLTGPSGPWWRRCIATVWQVMRPSRVLTTSLAMRVLLGAAVVLVVALPWYVIVGIKTDGAWLRGFLGDHNVGRFLGPKENHSGPVFYYVIALLMGCFPWSVFLPVAVWQLNKRLMQGDAWSDSDRFVACWAGVWFVFFSLASTKLPNYVLPMYPALALISARYLHGWQLAPVALGTVTFRNCCRVLAVVGVVLMIAAPIAASLLLPGDECAVPNGFKELTELFFKGPLGGDPHGEGVVVLPDRPASALEGLLQPADFQPGCRGEFAPDADEGAVLIEVIAQHVGAEVEEHFIPEREIRLLVRGQRDRRAQHVAKPVFVAEVFHLVTATTVGTEFTDEALFEANAMLPLQAEGFVRVGDLLPDAVLWKGVEGGIVAIPEGIDVRIADRRAPGGAESVVDAGTDHDLLPVPAEIGPPELTFEMQPPRPVSDGMIPDVVEPQVAVGIALVRGANADGGGHDEQQCEDEYPGVPFHGTCGTMGSAAAHTIVTIGMGSFARLDSEVWKNETSPVLMS